MGFLATGQDRPPGRSDLDQSAGQSAVPGDRWRVPATDGRGDAICRAEPISCVHPCEDIRVPRRRKQDHEDQVIDREVFRRKLLTALPTATGGIVGGAGGAGLRWGEAAGLCADAIDLVAGRHKVIRTIVEVGGPSSRVAPSRPPVVTPSRCPRGSSTSSADTQSNTDTDRRTCFSPTRSARGLRYHDLRHSSATWLVDDGVPPNMVQRVTGTNGPLRTLDLYTRRTENVDRILLALNDAD
jgi:integrase